MVACRPHEVDRLCKTADGKTVNPGLRLDRFCEVGNQEQQHGELGRVAGLPGDGKCLSDLLARRTRTLGALPDVRRWTMTTLGPLTLHLSRPSVLENAGICLHPVYGFAYLPGSGLKGMARAFAETVWLHEPDQQKDDKGAWEKIEDVFGWAPNPDRKRLNDESHPAHKRFAGTGDANVEIKACAGSVVFHDAWPTSWPKLRVDIVNCHHKKYYEQGEPPGDWEDPSPSYFLAVGSGTEFDFALSGRADAASASTLDLARRWLTGALVHLGAGAKTNAGYGRFKGDPTHGVRTASSANGSAWTCRISFVTPAFLGDASQGVDKDVALRPATLRGVIRAWWRAANGNLDVKELQRRESEFFGSTKVGTRLAIVVQESGAKPRFAKGTAIDPGAAYLGFGPITYNKSRKVPETNREAIGREATFDVTLRHSDPEGIEQVRRALWLLGAFGGVGSRSRRGWGGLTVVPTEGSVWPEGLPTLHDCENGPDLESRIRKGLDSLTPGDLRAAGLLWMAVSKDVEVVVGQCEFEQAREAMEDIGQKVAGFRHQYGQNARGGNGGPGPDYRLSRAILARESDGFPRAPERAAFGLPYAQDFRSTGNRVEFVPDRKGMGRRASPVLIRVHRLANQRYVWSVCHLPGDFLPPGVRIQANQTRQDGQKLKPPSSRGVVSPPGAAGYPGGQPGLSGSAGTDSTVPAGTTLVRELLAHLRAGRIAVPPAGSAARTTAPPSAPAPETAEEDWPNAKLVFKPGDGKIEASQQSGTRRTARVPLAEAVKQGAILPEVEMQLRGRKKVATATVRVRIQGGLVELIPLAKR